MAEPVLQAGDKLRLLHVIHTVAPEAGGTAAAAQSMCAALAERGHDVTLMATGPRRLQEQRGYRMEIFPVQFAPMAVSAGFARALAQHMDVDLVHIHMLYRFPQAAAAYLCRRRGIPYCIQPHGALEPLLFHKRERRCSKRLYEMLVENRNLRGAGCMIYTAEGERDATAFLKLPTPTCIVPLGLDMAQFNRGAEGFRTRHRLEGKELVAWMGRLVPVKGLDVLLAAFAVLARQRPQTLLVLIGPDPEGYGAMLRDLAARLGIAPDRLIFTGLLEGEAKLAALKESDLFVMPSLTENFALAALEAMAMGRPVIVSSGVKTSPAIARAGAGLVVEPQPEALTAAMCSLLKDEDMRRRMGEAAHAFASRHDWPMVIEALEKAYSAIVRR